MDENANANAQSLPADPAPVQEVANATNPTPTQEVAKGERPTADPQASEQFDPEIRKFLDNQNIKTDNLVDAVSELARRNMKLRSANAPTSQENTSNEAHGEAQSVADVLKPTAQQPQATNQQTSHGLSDMDIATVSMFVKQQYPDVTANAEFYKSMIGDGFKPVSADGNINLKSVLSYAKYQQKLADADRAIKAAAPQANQVPEPSNTPEYAKVEPVKTMTEQAAENIIMFSNQERKFGRPIHSQYTEAVEFLQNLARQKK